MRLSIPTHTKDYSVTIPQHYVLFAADGRIFAVKCKYNVEHCIEILERQKFKDRKLSAKCEEKDGKPFKAIEHGGHRKVDNIFEL